MKVAVLPLNAASGARPAVARQIAAFLAERAGAAGVENIGSLTLTMQYEDEGVMRVAQVNAAETLSETEMITQFFEQSDIDMAVDGLLEEDGAKGKATLRWWKKGETEPHHRLDLDWNETGLFDALKRALLETVSQAGVSPVLSGDDKEIFGTNNEGAFINFMLGLDAAQYVERSQGRVAKEFDPNFAYDALLAALEADKDWSAPLGTFVQMVRMCASMGLGTLEATQEKIEKLGEILPEDPRVLFAQAEFYGAVGDHSKAAELLEKGSRKSPDEPGIWSRLGMEQMALGMPVNAERSFRKAIELEPEGEKPSLDMLAQVLYSTDRGHEVAALWREQYDKNPKNPEYATKLALALRGAGDEAESDKIFEKALAEVEEPIVVKRHYATILRDKEDLDRAMDMYEDVLDENPTDVGVLLEYAQTLQQAGREFEVPKVLKDVLSTNPDPNTRAQTQAWLIQLEQPKRVEAVQSAHEKAQSGDFEAAMRELRPLRNWLGDYWPLWAALAGVHNALGEHRAAEEAARHLLEMFPACEPGYGEYSNALIGQSRAEEAYQFMRGALGSMNGSPAIALNFAFAAKASGRKEEAMQIAQQIREALELNPELEMILQQLES